MKVVLAYVEPATPKIGTIMLQLCKRTGSSMHVMKIQLINFVRNKLFKTGPA